MKRLFSGIVGVAFLGVLAFGAVKTYVVDSRTVSTVGELEKIYLRERVSLPPIPSSIKYEEVIRQLATGRVDFISSPHWAFYHGENGGSYFVAAGSKLEKEILLPARLLAYEDLASGKVVLSATPEATGVLKVLAVVDAPAFAPYDSKLSLESYLMHELWPRRIIWTAMLRPEAEAWNSPLAARSVATPSTEPMLMAMSASVPPPPGGTGGGGSSSNQTGGVSGESMISMTADSNSLVTMTINVPTNYTGRYLEIFSKNDLQWSPEWDVEKAWLPTFGDAMASWKDPEVRDAKYYVIADAGQDDDGDGYSNSREVYVEGTSPTNFNTVDKDGNSLDSDGDGIHDWLELKLFGSLEQTGTNDFDGDGLLNNEELNLGNVFEPVTMYTDPTLEDSDMDKVNDWLESEKYDFLDPNDPTDADYDGDGLLNYIELQIGSEIAEEDSDKDRLLDFDEYTYDLNVTNAALSDMQADSDGDGMTNGYEVANRLNPFDPADKYLDQDEDGLSNYWEYTNNLAAGSWDTDGDTLSDDAELYMGTDPTIPDDLTSNDDGDGLTLLEEYQNGTLPNSDDSDGDGIPDDEDLPDDGNAGGFLTNREGYVVTLHCDRRSKTRNKFGMHSFTETNPPKRYLKKRIEWTYLIGGNPESHVRGVGPGGCTIKYGGSYPGGKFNDLDEGSEGGWATPQEYDTETTTYRMYTGYITSYYDPPNEVDDQPATQNFTYQLYDEYTTDMLVSGVLDGMLSFKDWFSAGYESGHYTLSQDKMYCSGSAVQFKYMFDRPVTNVVIRWAEVCIKNSAPDSPSGKLKTCSVTGIESGVHVLNPADNLVPDSTYDIVPVHFTNDVCWVSLTSQTFNASAMLMLPNPGFTNNIEWTLTTLSGTNTTIDATGKVSLAGPGRYRIRAHLDFLKTCYDELELYVLKPEKIFVSFGDGTGYQSENLLNNYLDSLPNTEEIESDVRWKHNSTNTLKSFDIQIVGEDGFIEGLSSDGSYVAYEGHSNYGIGFAWENTHDSIDDFLNIGDSYTAIDWEYLNQYQQLNFIFPTNEIVLNPENYRNCVDLERFPNEPWMYGTNSIPYVGTEPPSNIFTTIYATGTEQFHFYESITPRIKRLIVAAGDADLPELNYKWLLLNSCGSAYYYADPFWNAGSTVFGTTDSVYSGTPAVQMFVQAVIEAKTSSSLESELNLIYKDDDKIENPYAEFGY